MNLKIILLVLAGFSFVACGGSGDGNPSDVASTSASAAISNDAVVMAVVASEAGGDAGHMATIIEVTTIPIVKSVSQMTAERVMKIMMVDGVAKRVSTCSGTATVKTDAGTATCTYQADCLSC